MTDYEILNGDLEAMVTDVPHFTANLANASALLYDTLDRINWAGFYLFEEDKLVLGPLGTGSKRSWKISSVVYGSVQTWIPGTHNYAV